MFSHVTVGSTDIARGKAFYAAIFAPLGVELKHDFKGAAGFGPKAGKHAMFWVLKPENRQAMSVGNGSMHAFAAADRKTVDAFHAAALAAGGADEGAPGLRPHYHPNYYGAYVRDLDGNKLCCVCHSRD